MISDDLGISGGEDGLIVSFVHKSGRVEGEDCLAIARCHLAISVEGHFQAARAVRVLPRGHDTRVGHHGGVRGSRRSRRSGQSHRPSVRAEKGVRVATNHDIHSIHRRQPLQVKWEPAIESPGALSLYVYRVTSIGNPREHCVRSFGGLDHHVLLVPQYIVHDTQ